MKQEQRIIAWYGGQNLQGIIQWIFTDQKKYRARKHSPESTRGAHEAGGAPWGVGCALHPCGSLVSFPEYFLFSYFLKYSKTEKNCHWNCFGVGLLTVPHSYSFSESETFRKVSLMYPYGVTVSITLVSTFIGLPEI